MKRRKNIVNAVSACLLSWRRPQNLRPIIDSLRQYEFITEILIWNNNSSVTLNFNDRKVRVINASENMICLGRFLCAQLARNEIIFVQDDDVIVGNVAELYQNFLHDNTRIHYGLLERHYRLRERNVYHQGHVALLGWGAFFRKSWLTVLEPLISEQGADFLFRREADKYFSLFLERRHHALPAKTHQLSGHSNKGIALYQEEHHPRLKAQAIRCALARLRESKSVRYPVTWNVVITSRNYASFIQDAVQSVLLNDADYVITIIDDASTDGTDQICQEFSRVYPHISYIHFDRRMGVSHARNIGVAAIDSLYVVLLDADDKIGADYLYEAEKLLRSGYDVANPDAILFGEKITRWRVPKAVSPQMLIERNYIHCCAAFRRSYWVEVGGVDESMDNWADYEFWIRVSKAGARIGYLPGNHFYYRKHGISKSTESKIIKDQIHAQIRSRHPDYKK